MTTTPLPFGTKVQTPRGIGSIVRYEMDPAWVHVMFGSGANVWRLNVSQIQEV